MPTESFCNGDGLQDGDDGDDNESAAKLARHISKGDVFLRQTPEKVQLLKVVLLQIGHIKNSF